jgi:amino acid adenylation domain-containing protein/thioester reductase-like protein
MSPALLDRPRGYSDLVALDLAASTCSVEANLAVQLSCDHPHAAVIAERAILMADLPAPLVAQLCEFDREYADSLATLMLASFSVFLARYADEQLIRLNIPAFQLFHGIDRPLPASQTTSGTIEIDLADEPAFAAVLQRLRASLRELLAKRDSGFATIAAQQEAYTVGFSYRRLQHDLAQIIPGEASESVGDLRLEIVATKHDIQAIWIYRADAFETATIARMHDHFQTMLAGIVADSTQPVSRLPLLTDVELDQLMVEWNDTAAPYQDTQRIYELFEEQVRRQPNAPALSFERITLTYHELNARANQLAHYLRGLGVGPEVLVGIFAERSIEMVVGILGVLKAGGAYVPLDPTYPIERLAFMLADAQMPVILTQQALDTTRQLLGIASDDHAGYRAPTMVYLDTEWARIAQESTIDPHSTITPDNLAYVIYTSGSTGQPKGTLLTHRGLCNLVMAQQQMFDLGPGKRVLQFASCSFDASIWELVMALCTGAALCLAPREVLASVPDLQRLLRTQSITTATLPPSLLALLPPEGLPMLTTVIAAGEACTPNLIARWAPGRRFFNAYGPTETTVCATWYECTSVEQRTPPIGRPLPNFQIYILDRHGRQVPIGVPGELHIGGIGLARGYLNRPELTAQRFIEWTPTPHMWSQDAGSTNAPPIRLYKTGDLARYRADGAIEFLGRIDHQIKLRGYRIELGEIEAALRWHPAVRDAIVLPREDGAGLQRLVAYVVIDSQQLEQISIDTSVAPSLQVQRQLRAYLRDRLPEYMVPSVVVPLDALPLTPNGKVDRRALPAPEDTALPALAAPRTPEEAVLVGIWANVLRRPQIGIHDDFFALGGHSLLAAQAISIIRASFGYDIPLHLLYKAPTVAAFARALGRDAGQPAPMSAAELRAEVFLDPSIGPPVPSKQPPSGQSTSVFLTGATGFLGAFLLNELLSQTAADVYCLVREADTEAAMRRMQQTLAKYYIWRDDWYSRIIPVLGDLRDPLFGLSEQVFNDLAGTIDAIYHAGGQVHYLYPYAALKAANVQGTVEVLRLACRQHLKPVHYISTILAGATGRAGAVVYENDVLADCIEPTGYGQSKWVSEGILRIARERGVPVAIYRPGRIGSDSVTGATNSNDFFVHLLASCIRIGLAPEVAMVENLIPVDYTAQAIVHLSRQSESANQTFHLLNPQSVSWSRVIGETNALGYQLQMVPYQTWYNALVEAATADPSHALHTLLPFLPRGKQAARWIERLKDLAAAGKSYISMSTAAATYIGQLLDQDFDTHNTDAGLVDSDMRCPAISALLLQCMLADGARRGLFAEPALVASTALEPDSILCLS